MTPIKRCQSCGTVWDEATTCETYFHQMLFWEAEDPKRGIVHHLMVLCYYLQHPHLYSQAGLSVGKELLYAFVQEGRSPADMREVNRDKVNSLNRNWKITARPEDKGRYTYPLTWTMRAADIVERGADAYVESVSAWAQSVFDVLIASHNFK